MKTIYVLDTSALVYDPFAWKQFPYSEVVIPIRAIKELDKLKKQPGEIGKNARVAIKNLKELKKLGDISTGIEIEDYILVRVDATHRDPNGTTFAGFGDPTYGDTHIMMCAHDLRLSNPGDIVILVSQDFNLQVEAAARGIESCELEGNRKSLSDLYSGAQTIVNEDAGFDLQQQGFIDPKIYGLELCPNECVLFEGNANDGIAMGRKVSSDRIKLIKKVYPWGVASRNKEQAFAIDLIMDRNVDLVTLIGKAGTGKSLIVLASALELVLNRREYDKFVIYRPIQPVGNDIGYLPGSMEEKLAPWFHAIMDNFEFLFGSKNGGDWRRELEMYQKKGKIEMEAITYIRGRSIPNSIILVDECQNLTREDVKTILTRAGENTKIILTGDIEQIDNSVLDATNNGLTHVIEKFKDSELAGHVTFVQGERSKLASKAAEIL